MVFRMRIGVAVILHYRIGGIKYILLTKRKDFGIYCLPGGVVEKGEDPKEAARREVLEETGLEVEIDPILTALTSKPNWMNGTIILVFKGNIIRGTLLRQTKETTHADFFNENNLPDYTDKEHMMYIRDFQLSFRQGMYRCVYRRINIPIWNGTREELYSIADHCSPDNRTEFYKRFFYGEQ